MTVAASALARLRVEQRGAQLGVLVDVLCDPLLTRQLGFEFVDGAGRHHFLPRATCHLFADRLETVMPPGFFNGDTVSYYRDRGASFARLRGAPVRAGAGSLGRLADIRFAADGSREALVVASPTGEIRLVEERLERTARPGGIAVRVPRPEELRVHARGSAGALPLNLEVPSHA